MESLPGTTPLPSVHCGICGWEINADELTQHLSVCDPLNRPDMVKCAEPNCNASFETKEKLAKHVRNVHSELVKCSFPDCSTTMKQHSLKRHIQTVHKKLRKKCPKCGNPISPSHLYRHLKFCKGGEGPSKSSNLPKPFKCLYKQNGKVCDKSFTSMKLRSDHMRRTHQTNMMKCSHPNCPAVFRKANKAQHMEKEHGIVIAKQAGDNSGK